MWRSAFKVDESSPLCVDWKNYTSPLPITTQFGLYDMVELFSIRT